VTSYQLIKRINSHKGSSQWFAQVCSLQTGITAWKWSMQETLYVLRTKSVGLVYQFGIVGRLWWCTIHQLSLNLVLFLYKLCCSATCSLNYSLKPQYEYRISIVLLLFGSTSCYIVVLLAYISTSISASLACGSNHIALVICC